MDWRDARLGADIGPGWVPLVDDLHRRVTEIVPDLVVNQVKEKFGGLRYYYDFPPGTPEEDRYEVDRLVISYENRAMQTCEQCGEPGYTDSARPGGWKLTLCEQHHEERRAALEQRRSSEH